MRCEQCGREGTRGYRPIPGVTIPADEWNRSYAGLIFHVERDVVIPGVVVCAAEKACQARRERLQPADIWD